jgi:hypothetical protein
MSRLLKLKEWLTIPDAARHLSGVCGEPVTDADVLRLGLDRHLKLSVYFVNKARARRGVVVPLEQSAAAILASNPIDLLRKGYPPIAELLGSELPTFIADGLANGSLIRDDGSLVLVDGSQFLHLEQEVTTIDGVWDLPLIGAERLNIEHLFQQLTGGPKVTLIHLAGTFVCNADGTFAQLQESFDSPKRKAVNELENYFPAGALPEDSVLVVRTSALTDFQSQITDESSPAKDSSQSIREKKSLLRIIGLMANHRYAGDIEKPYSIASHLTEKATELDVNIGKETIAGHIKAALALIEADKRRP